MDIQRSSEADDRRLELVQRGVDRRFHASGCNKCCRFSSFGQGHRQVRDPSGDSSISASLRCVITPYRLYTNPLAFYLLYGIGLGLCRSAVVQVGAPAVAAKWFIRKRGVAFATIPAAVGIAGVLFVQFAQGIVDWLDWRMVWRILGLFIIAVPVPLAWIVIRSTPEAIGLLPDGDEEPRLPRPGSESQASPSPTRAAVEVGWALTETFRTKAFWVLNISFVLITFPASSIIVVLHPYLTDIGISTSTAAQLLSFYAVAVIIGSVVWGVLVQILSARIMLVPFAVFYGLSIVAFILIGSSSVILLYLALLALGIGVTGAFQVGTQIWADYYGRKEIGSIIGVHMLARTLGGAFAPLVLALIRDETGEYLPGFKIYAVMCFVAGALLFFATPPRKSPEVGATSPGGLSTPKSQPPARVASKAKTGLGARLRWGAQLPRPSRPASHARV